MYTQQPSIKIAKTVINPKKVLPCKKLGLSSSQAQSISPCGFSMIPLDAQLRPTWLFNETLHEGCDRGGYYEQGQFADNYGSRECIVKLGCWGPVVQCNVGKRGWINGGGGCANVGGICIGCTMPGFPDKFMPQEAERRRIPLNCMIRSGRF